MRAKRNHFSVLSVSTVLGALALTFAQPSSSSASPIVTALNQVQDTSFITVNNSFDPPVPFYDVFSPLQAFTGTAVFQAGTVSGINGTTHQFTNLMGVTFYDGKHPGYSADVFGYFDTQGNFNPIISLGIGVGGSVTHTFNTSGDITFGLQTPDGLWSTDPTQNVDGWQHGLALTVTQAGTVNYNGNADLFGASTSFNLEVGDIILVWEDLIKFNSDNDYNDFAILIRDKTTVPEPSTVVLMALSLLGLAAMRRRTAGGFSR